jgi:predicted phage tail protein
MRDVYLTGPLAQTFGPGPHRLLAKNLRQLLAGLESRFPGFKRELIKNSDMAIAKVDGSKVVYVDEQLLTFDFGDRWKELHIGVGTRGSDPVSIGAAWTALGATAIGTAVQTIIISYAITKVMSYLSETTDVSEATQKADNKSTLFDGPGNKVTQGARVGLLFGEFLASSQTLSQALNAKREVVIQADDMTVIEGAAPQTVNIFANDYGQNSGLQHTVTTFVVDGTTKNAGETYYAPNIEVPAGTIVNTGGRWETIIDFTTAPAYNLTITADGTATFVTLAGSAPLSQTVTVNYDELDTSGTVLDPVTLHLSQNLTLNITSRYIDDGLGGGGS